MKFDKIKLGVGIAAVIFGALSFQETVVGALVFLLIGLALLFWWAYPRYIKKPAPSVQGKKIVPRIIDGSSLMYQYKAAASVTDASAAKALVKSGERSLDAEIRGSDVVLSSGGRELGLLLERADMLRDWIRRGDIYRVRLVEWDGKSPSCSVYLDFYKNIEKQYGNREQSVVKLVGYNAPVCQENILMVQVGEVLEFEEELGGDEVFVSGVGHLGRLPAKLANRYREEGAALVVLESVEADDNDVSVPVVRIYW